MAQLSRAPAHEANIPAIVEVHQSRILVADGDATARDSITQTLRREGYEAVEFENGADLTDYIVDSLFGPDRYAPDAIVADVHLPIVSGTAILNGVRSLEGDMPVVLIAATADARTERAVRAGATVVYKPFNTDVLVALVCAAIQQRDALHRTAG